VGGSLEEGARRWDIGSGPVCRCREVQALVMQLICDHQEDADLLGGRSRGLRRRRLCGRDGNGCWSWQAKGIGWLVEVCGDWRWDWTTLLVVGEEGLRKEEGWSAAGFDMLAKVMACGSVRENWKAEVDAAGDGRCERRTEVACGRGWEV
jgi:hypothetical protein